MSRYVIVQVIASIEERSNWKCFGVFNSEEDAREWLKENFDLPGPLVILPVTMEGPFGQEIIQRMDDQLAAIEEGGFEDCPF